MGRAGSLQRTKLRWEFRNPVLPRLRLFCGGTVFDSCALQVAAARHNPQRESAGTTRSGGRADRGRLDGGCCACVGVCVYTLILS